MKARTTQINHPSELNGLTALRLFRKRGRGLIRLSAEFDHPEKEQWQAQINRYYYACGCSTGAKGLMMMLLLGIAYSGMAYLFRYASLRQVIVIPILAAVAGALIGKLIGLTAAHSRLVRVVHTIQAHWKTHDPKEEPLITCG